MNAPLAYTEIVFGWGSVQDPDGASLPQSGGLGLLPVQSTLQTSSSVVEQLIYFSDSAVMGRAVFDML